MTDSTSNSNDIGKISEHCCIQMECKENSQICRDFLRGVCQRGHKCRFLHPAQMTVPHYSNIPICRDFQNGTCTRKMCKYAHTEMKSKRNYSQFSRNLSQSDQNLESSNSLANNILYPIGGYPHNTAIYSSNSFDNYYDWSRFYSNLGWFSCFPVENDNSTVTKTLRHRNIQSSGVDEDELQRLQQENINLREQNQILSEKLSHFEKSFRRLHMSQGKDFFSTQISSNMQQYQFPTRYSENLIADCPNYNSSQHNFSEISEPRSEKRNQILNNHSNVTSSSETTSIHNPFSTNIDSFLSFSPDYQRFDKTENSTLNLSRDISCNKVQTNSPRRSRSEISSLVLSDESFLSSVDEDIAQMIPSNIDEVLKTPNDHK